MVFFERGQGLVKAPGQRRDIREFLGRKIINVFIERRARIDTILNAVKTCHKQGGKSYIRITAGIGRAKFEPFCFR